MRKSIALWGIFGLAACTSAVCTSAAHAQSITVGQMLNIKPKFEDVAITTPSAEEMAACRVSDVVIGGKKAGYALVDGRKQVLRRYFASKDPQKIDTWSFYKDGVEVLRQQDSNLDGKVDQYRWLGTGGMKWGVDVNQDGKIDAWRMISADEVAHEAFLALAQQDFERLKAVLITPAEIQAVGLSAEQAAAATKALQQAQSKFQQSLAKLPKLANATYLRVEGHPGCYLAETTGVAQDLIKFGSRSVLFETADKKHDWIQTGEIIQVGLAWRLLDVPGAPDDAAAVPGQRDSESPELRKLLADLSELDKEQVGGPQIGANPALAAYNERRSAVIEQIVPHIKDAQEKETWYKQIFDNLGAATIAGSETARKRLVAYRDQLTSKMPGSNLAAYAVFRELWAGYQPKLSDPKLFTAKLQDEWHDALAKFVKQYPNADDTPEALNTLGMGMEFTGKEDEAARWYSLIYTNFKEHPNAESAKGAERRLKLVGNPLELSGLTLQGNQQFDVKNLKDKVAIVYYWASYCSSCPDDFNRLKKIMADHGKDGVELVCVNLDLKTEDGLKWLQDNPTATSIGAKHLGQTGKELGLKGPLATQYGINILPTVFLVGRDGRVLNTKVHVGDMEEVLKKALK